MNPAEHPPDPADLTLLRRHVLRVTGAGIVAGLVLTGAAPPAVARPKAAPRLKGGARDPGSALSAQEVAITLQVARLGAVYPVPFPDFGEAGPAESRATAERLRARLPEIGAARLRLVRDGAGALAAAGLTAVSRDRLLDGLAGVVAKSGAEPPREVTALTALAVATVSTSFSPNDDDAALFWLGGLRQRHLRPHTGKGRS